MEDAGEHHRFEEGAGALGAEMGEEGVELEAMPEVFEDSEAAEIEGLLEEDGV